MTEKLTRRQVLQSLGLATGGLLFAKPGFAAILGKGPQQGTQLAKTASGEQFAYDDNVRYSATKVATPGLTAEQTARVEKILGPANIHPDLAKHFNAETPSVFDVLTHALGITPRNAGQTKLLPGHCSSEKLRIEGPRSDGVIYWRGKLGERAGYFAESDIYEGNASKNNTFAQKSFFDSNGEKCRRFRFYYTLQGEEAGVDPNVARRVMWECDFNKFWGGFLDKVLKAYEGGNLAAVPALIRDVMNVQSGQTNEIRGNRTYFSGFSWEWLDKQNDLKNLGNPNSKEKFSANPAGDGSGRQEQIDGINGALAGDHNRAYHSFDRYRIAMNLNKFGNPKGTGRQGSAMSLAA